MKHPEEENGAEEISRIGEEIYARDIHTADFEAEHSGEFLVADTLYSPHG